MVMPLKLAGILMKYMQLQRAQCPPTSRGLINLLVPVAVQAGLRKICLFYSHHGSSAAQPWHCFRDTLKGGEHPTKKLGKTTHFSLLCEKLARAERARARLEQAGICPCGEHAGFLQGKLWCRTLKI